jgi:hypothetical protein
MASIFSLQAFIIVITYPWWESIVTWLDFMCSLFPLD